MHIGSCWLLSHYNLYREREKEREREREEEGEGEGEREGGKRTTPKLISGHWYIKRNSLAYRN
jgi:hypothetical protein